MSRQFISETLLHLDAIDARDKRKKANRMHFLEQWILGMVVQLLHGLKFDPARIPVLRSVLLSIYDDIGIVLGLPPRAGTM